MLSAGIELQLSPPHCWLVRSLLATLDPDNAVLANLLQLDAGARAYINKALASPLICCSWP